MEDFIALTPGEGRIRRIFRFFYWHYFSQYRY